MGIFVALRGMLGDSKVAKALMGFGAPRPKPAIHVDRVGFGLALDPAEPDRITPAVSWAEVQRVVAFKRDLFAVDLVCLQIEFGDDRAWEVNEEMAGWGELLDSMPSVLPGCMTKDEILDRVVQPPMATNETVVYERSSA